MKDEEDKSNMPTLPPPGPGAAGGDASNNAPEAVALIAKAYAKVPAMTAPLLTSSTLDEEDGWGSPKTDETVEAKAITDSMPTPKAFEIYQAPAADGESAGDAAAASSTPETPRAPSAKPLPSSSMPTPFVMAIQPPPPSVPPEVDVKLAPKTPAIEMPVHSDPPPKKNDSPASAASLSSRKSGAFDAKFIAAVVGAIVILAAVCAWAFR